MLQRLLDLISYNRWAHLRTLGAAEALSAESLHRDMGSSFPSVFATLKHMLEAEFVWLSRWNGDPRGASPELTGVSDVAALREHWHELLLRQDEFLSRLSEADVDRRVDVITRAGVASSQALDLLLRHVVNQSTYHRGQVTTLLRQLGATPVATDLVAYDRQRTRSQSTT